MASDLRYAIRSLLKAPGFSSVAAFTLAIGISATTAIYTALERVVLDPLPYPEAGRLVRLKSAVPFVAPGEEWDVSQGAWWFFGREAQALETLGAYRYGGANVTGPEGPERARTASVTATTLTLLGAEAVVGRLFDETEDDPGGPSVAVVSHGYWRRQLGGSAAVIGTTLAIDERPYEVIGVMAPGAELPPEAGVPSDLLGIDVWLPLRLNPAGPFQNFHVEFRTIARLAPGSGIESAQAELDELTARLPEVLPNVYSPRTIERGFATRAYSLKSYVVGEVGQNLWILFAAVGLVLLIAVANVGNLFLVRAEGRRRELAVRTALGASRTAIWRQSLAEGLVLSITGGVIGLAMAFWGVDWLAALAPDGIPRLAGVQADGSVVAFTLALSLLVAVAVGALPAFRAGRASHWSDLAEGARGFTLGRARHRVRSGLVIVQVALALVLLAGAGLLTESWRRLRAVDLGVDPTGVLTAQVYLPTARYSIDKMWPFHRAALERIRAIPGVAAAGLTSDLPLAGGFGCTVQGFEDRAVYDRLAEAGETTCAGQEPTSPGYFEAMGIPVLKGRGLTQEDLDDPGRGVVVVSQAFAERFWPGDDPIGKGVGPNGITNQQFYRVVGVVGDVYAGSAAGPRGLAIYYPMVRIPGTAGWWPNPMTLVVKSALAGPSALLASVQRAVRDVDPAIPLANVEMMETLVARSVAQLSFTMTMIAVAALTALLLAAVGLYGVVSYLVTRRTPEIGVRMALGAQPAQVARLVVGGSVRMSLAGAVIGILVALATSRVLSGLLYGVETTHPVAYLGAAVVLGAVAALAAYLPARRAARVDPMEALRYE